MTKGDNTQVSPRTQRPPEDKELVSKKVSVKVLRNRNNRGKMMTTMDPYKKTPFNVPQ